MSSSGCAFSVIIPTCNRPVQLGVCLRALAAQDYPKDGFEVVVVDDGGDFPAAAVVRELDLDLDLRLLRQSNQGPGAARNAGAEQARGYCLAFTDDDCLPEPGWLSALAAVQSSSHPHPVMLGGPVVNALTGSACSSASQLIVDLVYEYYNGDSCQPRFFASNNMALPAASFRALGGFEPSFRTAEDRDLCDRWLQNGHTLLYVP